MENGTEQRQPQNTNGSHGWTISAIDPEKNERYEINSDGVNETDGQSTPLDEGDRGRMKKRDYKGEE